jgi:hypothetical protein
MVNFDDILKDGACVVTLSSWQEFKQEAVSLKSKRGYVWRGQKKDEDNGWSLQSSFDRKMQIKEPNARIKRLRRHLDNFKGEMNRTYPDVLPQDDVGIWALGQHYGLKTPLLDWTLSPFIAAYFAFSEKRDPKDQNDHYRYVYGLNRSLERLLSKLKKAGEILSADRSVTLIDQLPYPNPRFTAQKGIFSKAFQGNDITKYIQSFSRKRPREVLIVKFRIPTKDRQECLHELHLMDINHMSLLLDLRDVVESCNNKL